MFAKSFVILMLIFFRVASCTSIRFYLHFVRFLKVFWLSVSVTTTFMCSCIISIISSFENIRKDLKIEIFPIPITYWSGFGILKQDWDGSVSLKIGRQMAARRANFIWRVLEVPRIRRITELLYL